jgi:CheY-like chemotaxis protein
MFVYLSIPGLDIIQNDEQDCERKVLIQEIQNSANSAVTVLNEVLQYDKIEQKNLMLELTVLDIWALVSTQLLDFKLLAQKNRVQLMLAFDVPSCAATDVECGILSNVNDLPMHIRNLRVIGDVSKILQVLRNLISNALTFTPEEGLILLTISYTAEQPVMEKVLTRRGSNISKKFVLKDGEEIAASPHGDFVLHVMDSGVGMSESEIDRLFGEGVQFNANDLQAGKGSGLGLFISKNLVEQHGGRLTAKSEGIGKGSAFTLQLPLYQCDISSSDTEEHQGLEECMTESSSNENNEKRQLRILVVDDIVTNRKLLSRLLERNGHECSMAENGEVAVAMVRENMSSKDGATRLYDCILMDYEMPVLNGPNATEKIREMGCDVPIVGITGNTLSDDVQHFESKGANAVLSKPVKLEVLENLFVEYGL